MSRKSSLDAQDLGLKPDHAHVEEAPTVIEIETFRVLGLSPEDADFYTNYPEEKRKRVIHKVIHHPVAGSTTAHRYH